LGIYASAGTTIIRVSSSSAIEKGDGLPRGNLQPELKIMAKKTEPKIKTTAPAKKATKPAAKKKTATAKAKPGAKVTQPKASAYTQDDVALRAYFIAEKRRNHGLPGDEHGDWVEAVRQLAEESAKPKKTKKA